jgi:hypothetical protein
MCRSSTKAGVYKPTHGGFVDVDIEKDMSISLRTLVSLTQFYGFFRQLLNNNNNKKRI